MNDIQINDFKAIKHSIKKYLNKKITLMELINNIEILANATFDTNETEELYSFLINNIADLECEYFMKVDAVSNEDYFNYREELIILATNFLKNIEKYDNANSTHKCNS